MSELPGHLGDLPPEPNSDAATEPTPVVTSVQAPDVTGTAPRTGKSRAKWRWPHTRRNQIAASVAIAAGAVAIVAAVFTGGVAVGSHVGVGEHHGRWGNHSEMSAQREGIPTEQIWIFPEGASAPGHPAPILTGSVATLNDQP
jgi:hypothetical protein